MPRTDEHCNGTGRSGIRGTGAGPECQSAVGGNGMRFVGVSGVDTRDAGFIDGSKIAGGGGKGAMVVAPLLSIRHGAKGGVGGG